MKPTLMHSFSHYDRGKPQVNQPQQAKNSGQGMLEFALAIPILLLILLGTIEMGRLLFFYSSVASASREAARYGAAVDNFSDCTGIRDAAKRVGFFAGIEDSDITIFYDNLRNGVTHTGCPPPMSQVQPGTRIIVYIRTDYAPVVPLVPVPTFPVESNNTRTIISNLYLAENSGSGGGPPPPPPPPPELTMHVGDLTITKLDADKNNWTAIVTITVHNDEGNPLSSVNVKGKWDGTNQNQFANCTTGMDGTCSVSYKNPDNSKTYRIIDLIGTPAYKPSDNYLNEISIDK
jgi:hypothetical protein